MVLYVKEKGRITNAEYQQLCTVSKRTASDGLSELEAKGLLERVGTTGKGTYYRLKGEEKGRKGQQRGNKGAKVTES